MTFGLLRYDIDLLADAVRLHVANGFAALKSVVAINKGGWGEDVWRLKAIRDAVSPGIDIMIDANYLFNPVEAKYPCREIEDCRITWFEEPLTQNDARAMGDLRRSTKIPMATGQMEGRRWRHREFIEHHSFDILPPNVAYCGGFTEVRKYAHMAQTCNMPIAKGGGSPLFNMHLLACMMNGWIAEWHLGMVAVGETLFTDAPRLVNGRLDIPVRPDLGLTVNEDAFRDTLID
ncbi:enolase C-terminal domain-like protein [Hoeflea ulvae]|uniref:Mandelate racemase/muconate lactonizing enzyme C-terminal domain-containing protein n=1 Tax=Hoeflea ulvae TaxID=2983764 RepID=A0ABT3YDH9_9HYPH|nr:enolase C-terminal domain-like protein [Hoeflea ulvae]MCY0093839.1 hypothetical protein [Hoeflea ulvae]